MITVTGATGKVGRALVERLAGAGEQVRAVSRDPARAGLPAGVEVVAGDVTDPASLTAAAAGADAAFLLWPLFGRPETLRYAPAAVAALRVPRIVHLSAQPAEVAPDSPWALVEREVERTGAGRSRPGPRPATSWAAAGSPTRPWPGGPGSPPTPRCSPTPCRRCSAGRRRRTGSGWSTARTPSGDRAAYRGRVTKPQIPTPVVEKTDAEWRAELSPAEYKVLRQAGTERPWVGKYTDEKRTGIYRCRACATELFRSDTKFDSHCGWPSFWSPLAGDRVILREDRSLGSVRVEVLCAACHSHLGHVFSGEGYGTPTDDRYCINSISLTFTESVS